MFAEKAARQRISVRKEFIEQTRLRLGFERKLRLQMQTAFAEVGQTARKEYTQAGRLLRTGANLAERLSRLLESHYRAVIDAFGLRILRNYKGDSQFETLIQQYINQYGAVRVTQITNTTMNQIRRVISAGEADGLGVAVIGKNIFESQRGSFSRIRSATIARTETHSAASYANHEVNASLKIPNQKKRWVATADLRSRPSHAAANNTEVDIDEDFIIGGVAMGYTGDPRGGAANVINCRCVTLYITPEDDVFVDDSPPTPVRPIQKPWGETSEFEEKFHNIGDWQKTGTIRSVIRNTTALSGVIFNARRAYYSADRIAMHVDKDLIDPPIGESTVWRHEYGHHIDFAMGRRLRGGRAISEDVVDDALKDRRMYGRAKRRAIDEKADNEFRDFLKANQITINMDAYNDFATSGGIPQPPYARLRRMEESDRDGFSQWLRETEIDEKFIDDTLKGTPFTSDDIIKMFGDGKNKKGQIRSGGPKGLLNIVNGNETQKEKFVFFLNDLKANRIGSDTELGYGNWLITHSHDQEGLMFTDFLEAMSNAVVGQGHGKAYLNKRRAIKRGITEAHTTEMMANYTALMGGDRAKTWRKFLQYTAPNSLAKMDELFTEMADVGVMTE